MNGQSLYELYCKVFKTIFAPTWPALTEDSRASWEELALEINNRQWMYMRGVQTTPPAPCPHEHLDMDGLCHRCGEDRRGM